MKKILLIRIAWMKYYNGWSKFDFPVSGAKYVKKNKSGAEETNFKNINGKVFGYIPFNKNNNINNLGASDKDDFINGVTIVFCAVHPQEKIMRVVGWYKKATVYREMKFTKNGAPYGVTANYKDCTLIPYTDRNLQIPHVFGRNSVCYITLHKSKEKVLQKIEKYIASGGKLDMLNKPGKSKIGRAYQPDVIKRIKVENAAIKIAFKYYRERYGYENVKSTEKENIGWDLEVRAGSIKIKVEVKGLSGNDVSVQLSPNEYKAFLQKDPYYRLFVVTKALDKRPVVRIFEYQEKGKIWTNALKEQLKINQIKAARLIIKQ
jgi:hypothetical protein